jgi:Xaa-Pro aminopeptidase
LIKSKNKRNKFLVDFLTCSIFYQKLLENLQIPYIYKLDPIYFLKSIKNNKEILNSKKSHISDGVALTKFIYWIKSNIKKLKITELSAQKKLENFRKKNRHYKFPSFNTISGSGPNGSIIHYKANNNTNRLIKKSDIYLFDSGGQYHYGTTDVTRTICFKSNLDKMKNIFTRVLKGHIGVTLYNIKKNTTGKEIDLKARSYLKKINLDYAHGTGHGVGYFLNVHEGPHGISKNNSNNFKEGMIVSNEPGYYKNNKFGIRIENLLYIKKYKKKLKFENLTLAPIEKDLINFKMLNAKEKKYLESYHKKVYLSLRKFLNDKEKIWLKSVIN